jgi:hypothetical protein
MASDEEQKVAGSETFVAVRPSQWRWFLREVELFDLITALATTSIAILTGFYVHYTRGQLAAIRDQLQATRVQLHDVERAFRLDHRPWVIGSDYSLSAEPGTKAPTIKLWVRNAGNTPATAVVCQGKMVLSNTQPPEFEPKSTTERPIGSGQLGTHAEAVTIYDT